MREKIEYLKWYTIDDYPSSHFELPLPFHGQRGNVWGLGANLLLNTISLGVHYIPVDKWSVARAANNNEVKKLGKLLKEYKPKVVLQLFGRHSKYYLERLK